MRSGHSRRRISIRRSEDPQASLSQRCYISQFTGRLFLTTEQTVRAPTGRGNSSAPSNEGAQNLASRNAERPSLLRTGTPLMGRRFCLLLGGILLLACGLLFGGFFLCVGDILLGSIHFCSILSRNLSKRLFRLRRRPFFVCYMGPFRWDSGSHLLEMEGCRNKVQGILFLLFLL